MPARPVASIKKENLVTPLVDVDVDGSPVSSVHGRRGECEGVEGGEGGAGGDVCDHVTNIGFVGSRSQNDRLSTLVRS